MSPKTDLTDENFWDNFWQTVKLPALIDEGVQWQMALAKIFREYLVKDQSLKAIEIGCAPGRWLIWFNKNFGYKMAGCDNSPRGMQLTQKNLELNLLPAELYSSDLQNDGLPKASFDIAFSLGVIEHFDDPLRIVEKHLELLKPGGTLVLEVPNMAGRFNYWLLRRAKMQNLLKHHNLDVMRKEFFFDIAERFHLQIRLIDYVGGFDPGLVVHNHSYKSLWRRPAVFYILWLLEKLSGKMPLIPKFLMRRNAPSFSNMLIAIFVKPAKADGLNHEN